MSLEPKLFRPNICKFCKANVFYSVLAGRIVEPDGKTAHSDNCEKRKAYYSQRSAETAQARRNEKL